jgi:hypothetical protein
MARVRLKGVNKVTTRLADGRLVTYWYAWKGGPRLVGHPGSPEFVQSNEAAYRQTRKADPKTFHAIISGYKQSRDFTDLAPRTQRDYLKHIAHIEKAFADLPIAALSDPRITSDFIKWRDGLPLGDRQQDYAWTILMRLISWARDRARQTIAHHPACENSTSRTGPRKSGCRPISPHSGRQPRSHYGRHWFWRWRPDSVKAI